MKNFYADNLYLYTLIRPLQNYIIHQFWQSITGTEHEFSVTQLKQYICGSDKEYQYCSVARPRRINSRTKEMDYS